MFFNLQVGKVSPRVQVQQNWNDNRSQSSEDIYQEVTTNSSQPRNMIFHSRGPSPVNSKGRNMTEKLIAESGFRRNDPKRHSSPRINMRSENRMRISPPKPPVKKNAFTNNNQTVQNGSPNRRMFWSPERQQNNRMLITRKNSAPVIENPQSPVIEKLKQHSDLCSDKNFLMKIEQLIEEFQARTKFNDADDFDRNMQPALPPTIKEDVDSKLINFPVRRSPVENCINKSPSKIPLPTWYSKCQS